MDDQYAVLLEKVIAENIRLREVIETRDSDQRNMIQELTSIGVIVPHLMYQSLNAQM